MSVDPALLREARESWLEHLRQTVGHEAVWGRTNDILDGSEDSEDFIVGFLAASPSPMEDEVERILAAVMACASSEATIKWEVTKARRAIATIRGEPK
jgi:hypothetical protein